ncbi:uncharacterized protein LOC111400275 [Olea europaea var. sylvestris]|uniref:uncharacterized protein LOC111400275 n=1 Tax=Olea europaea var. sylvestris TaxID=158386 RepID=UPI000C1D2F71|nr:uncharacterized protein LOC111400275 [Olea europaea var. sylvestris]
MFSLVDMSSSISDAAIENVGHIDESDVEVMNVADGMAIKIGMIFRNKETMKMSLAFYAIQNMFESMVVRSDKKEYLVRCSREKLLGAHRQVIASVVSTCIRYKYNSSRTRYTPNDIRNDMLHNYGVSLNYVKAWRSRERTLKMLRDQMNPGTVTGLELDSHNRFKYCFMAIGAPIRGWQHCRPMIVVDATYLNGHHGGSLFTTCTQDANNSIFILAFGIGDNENDESWTWFFEQLKRAYGNRKGLCFVSDRHNSIKNAIENVYPRTYHGICSYHLLQNLKSYFGKSGQNITQAFNSTVRAYTLAKFEYNMRQLDSINPKITAYLVEVNPEKWSRFHMPANRYSIMISNIVKSVTAVTKAAKNFPVVVLLDSLRQTIQFWFYKHRDTASGTFTKMSGNYEKILGDMSYDLRNFTVSPTNQTIFSVCGDSSSFIVDMEQRTCTCRTFQVDQLPYPHALTVIAMMKMDAYDYCSYLYTRDAYVNAYKHTVFPIGNINEWTVPNEVVNVVVLPPNHKRSTGRPSEKRKRSSCEGKIIVKCGRCGGNGHNRRTCTSLVPLGQS